MPFKDREKYNQYHRQYRQAKINKYKPREMLMAEIEKLKEENNRLRKEIIFCMSYCMICDKEIN